MLVDSIPAGVYVLAIEHLGYGNARTVEFTVVPCRVRDLGTMWTADIGLRLRMLENRASLGLTFRDPFGLRDSSQETRDPSVLQTERTRISSRSVSAAISYGFGGGAGRPRGGPPVRR